MQCVYPQPTPVLDPATVLFGKTRRAILGLLFHHPDVSFNLRDIARNTGASVGAVHRDLTQLCRSGLIQRKPFEWWVIYEPERDHPIFGDVESIVQKTMPWPELKPFPPITRGWHLL